MQRDVSARSSQGDFLDYKGADCTWPSWVTYFLSLNFMVYVFLGKPVVLWNSHHILILKKFVSKEIVETSQEMEVWNIVFFFMVGIIKIIPYF